ncbi:unnamed protein product, partial [Phaeothamnion confervicola]
MLLPLLPLPKLPSDADGMAAPDEVVKRLSVVGEVVFDGAEHIAAIDVTRFKPLLHACACRVGTFSFPPPADADWTDAAVAWLDLGARRIVVRLREHSVEAAEAFSTWAGQLSDSRRRFVVSLASRDFSTGTGAASTFEAFLVSTATAVCDGLRSATGAVHFDLDGCSVLQSTATVAALVGRLHGKEGSATYLEVALGDACDVVTRAFVAESADHPKGAETANSGKIANGRVGSRAATTAMTNGGGGGSTPAEASAESAVVAAASGSGVDAAAAIAACLRSDRDDGLITTVVVDASGVALGLVYSNAASIAASLAAGRGIYWSRSRGGIWRKGDTSGAWQALLGVSLDCDSDALRFVVEQHGNPPAFCHLNRRACWPGGGGGGSGVAAGGAFDGGLGHLERTLRGRLRDSPPGSYTARLFADPALLRNKLVEEAQELAEATATDHVASEV